MKFAAPALMVLALAACADPQMADYDTRLAHPATVTKSTARMIIEPSSDGVISPNDARRLTLFAQDYLRRGSGPFELAVVATDENDESARATAFRLAEEVMQRGVRSSEIKARLVWDNAPSDTGMAVLSYPHHVAQLPECGTWKTPINFGHDNRNSDNFGCAVQRNIAAMAADPRDLESARPTAGRDGERAADIMAKYHKGSVIAAPKEVGTYTTTTTQTGNTTSGN